jgi:hypothetical protein
MKLLELMQKAAKAYDSDGTLELCFNPKTGVPWASKKRKQAGDTLAEFVVVELAETFDSSASEKEQKQEARRVMNMAIRELENVIAVF